MKIGIMGLPQSGRRTVFELLTGVSAATVNPEGKDPVTGIAAIVDPRFDLLAARYRPKKEARARITVEFLPALEEAAIRDGAVFRDIAGTDALCLVAREFADERVYHVHGSVDPLRDAEAVMAELLMHDLIFIEKRMERIAEGKKRSRDDRAEKEEPALSRMRGHLERDLPLRAMDLSADEKKLLAGYPFITLKELVIALNRGESSSGKSPAAAAIESKYGGQRVEVVEISAAAHRWVRASLNARGSEGSYLPVSMALTD